MNAERLHAILLAIQSEVEQTNSLVSTLANSLRKQVGSPTDANLQVRVSTHRDALNNYLSSAGSNGYPPVWREQLETLGIDNLLGEQLRREIESTFLRESVTPAAVAEAVEGYVRKLADLLAAVNSMITGFSLLKIKPDTLEPGQVELGILIPRGAVDNQLDKLGAEFREINDIVQPFAELATGSRPLLTVREISSSEFGLFLDIDPATAACIAVAVERTINFYKSLLEIKKLRSEMVNNGMPAEALNGVDDYAAGIMKNGISETLAYILETFGKQAEPGRKNELKVELTLSLNSIANRIDRGYNVEVRAQPPIASDGEPDSPAAAARAEYFATIGKVSQGLKYVRRDGAPMLQLPTSSQKPAAQETLDDTSTPSIPTSPTRKRSSKNSPDQPES